MNEEKIKGKESAEAQKVYGEFSRIEKGKKSA